MLSDVPKGNVDWVPTQPSKARRLPMRFRTATGSMHSGWTGFRMVMPISTRSSRMSQILPSEWYQMWTSGLIARAAAMTFAQRGFITSRQRSGLNIIDFWLATSSPVWMQS